MRALVLAFVIAALCGTSRLWALNPNVTYPGVVQFLHTKKSRDRGETEFFRAREDMETFLGESGSRRHFSGIRTILSHESAQSGASQTDRGEHGNAGQGSRGLRNSQTTKNGRNVVRENYAAIEKMNRLATHMRDMLAKAKAEGRDHFTSAEREKYHRLEAEYSELEEARQIENGNPRFAGLEALAAGRGVSDMDLEELRDTFRLSGSRKRAIDKSPHGKAFSNYLRKGETLTGSDRELLNSHNQRFHNAMSTVVGTQGGDLVPQGFSNQLEEAKKWFGGIEGTVERFPTGTGNTMPWPTVNDTTNMGRIIGENVQTVETDLVFNTVTFSAYIGSSDLILIPLALIQDSYFDLDALAAKLLGIRLGRLFNRKCTVGTGTNEPTGIVTAAAAAGNIFQPGPGNTANVNYAFLIDLQHSVDPSYRDNPSTRWMFSDTVLKLLKMLVDGNGRPLWSPGLTASFRDSVDVVGSKPMILGSEYVINQDMPIPAANAYSMLFGDMSTYKVREVAGGTTVLVLRERYADYLQVGMTAFQRFDGNLVDAGTHPIAVLQQSAT